MATITPPTDPLAEFFNNLIFGLTSGAGATAIEGVAELEFPPLAYPIIKQIFEAIIGDLAGKLAVVEEQGVLKLVFTVQNDSKLYALGVATLALQKAKQSGDENAISQATQNAIDKWGEIIHFGGVAPVQS